MALGSIIAPMAKTRTQYVCKECGRRSAREMGRCPQCNAWNSYVEEIVEEAKPDKSRAPRGMTGRSTPRRLGEISGDAEERMPLPIGEFARVLGGGVVPGSIVLIGGDPGIGKSTLLLQTALEMAKVGTVLYVSGEESERQIKMRAIRLLSPSRSEGERSSKSELRSSKSEGEPKFPEDLLLVTETNLTTILEHVTETRPHLLIVDSIQTVYMPELESSAGSVTQVRESASRLRELAKSSGVAVFLIGHVTKEGAIAGPRVLEHIVDTVLYLEGDRFQSYRLLRSVKNRFGATSEVGVFEMLEQGMVEVPNPSEAFLAERMINAPGSAIAVTMEGTRPLLVEIQGLTSSTSFGNPRRTPNGLDINRLLLTVAVLTRRVGVRLAEQDVFVNVVGGLRVDEPAADLAVAASIASSINDHPVRADTVLIGEIGLSGELRSVGQMPARLREAASLGFKTAIVPRRLRKGEPWPKGIEIIEARSLRQALDAALVKG
jgi:DNA repair protein RadA/Sms